LAFGLLLGWYAGVVITCLLLVDVVYSLRPVRISHRPYMVGITLTFGYVVGPFLIGLLSQGGDLKDIDQLLLFGLSLIFWGRIILKDFRDRVGDSAVGKETLLSRLGKANLLYASQLAIVLGLSVLCVSSLTLAAKIAVVIVGGIGIMLINQINTVPEGDEEQKLIGVSARMGNGALSLIITDLLLVKYAEYSVLIIIMLGVIYVVNAYKLWSHRDRIKLGYKG
jgi:4-hydroxybenzoate polyprenyltransferase